ncbi:unnamed protein product [Schistocephalus solidus]|uniref:Coiled-coil domain-containing protein 146 n=1 Tax=Schistocephalus solidus TaxID=70667 RepID=A0A183S714_SCHSO|nr:unnamed protein product [Schistocephalus solidus]
MADADNIQNEILIAKPRLQPRPSIDSCFENEQTSDEADVGTTKKNEKALLNHLKDQTVENSSLEKHLKRAENYPEGFTNKADTLRAEVLMAGNRTLEIEERLEDMQYTIAALEEEKMMLSREAARFPSPEEVEKRRRFLEREIDALTSDVQKGQFEGRRLRNSLREAEEELSEEDGKLEALKNELNALRVREGKRLLKAARDELEQSTKERLELLRLQSQMEAETSNLASAKMEVDMQHLQQERNRILELSAKQTKERDRELRLVRQATTNLKILQDTVNFLAKTQTSLKQEMELQRASQNTGSLKTELSGMDQVKIQELIADQESLFSEMLEERKQAISLCRLVCMKSEETIQKQRYLKTAKAHFARVVSDMQLQDMALVEPRKRLRLLEGQLRDFSKLYDDINMDRNKCLSLISMARQRKLELREKIRLYDNELELIKSGLAHKEYQVQLLRTKHAKASEQCTTLRNDLSKLKNVNSELSTEIDRVSTTVNHLKKVKSKTEADIQLLDKSYEKMVRLRNDRSAQLIERNEEVCALQENLRRLEEQVQRAEVQLTAREEEVTALQLLKKEQLRALEAARGQLCSRRAVETELVDLQIELALAVERLQKLEALAEDPNAPLLDLKTGRTILPPLPAQSKVLALRSKEDAAKDLSPNEGAVETFNPAGRLRLLEGRHLSGQQITEKIEELEVKITKKEALLLERKMILEATERLVDDLKEQAVAGNEVTLQLAVHVNGQQATSKNLTRQMKAVASELTMRMIECQKLDSKAKVLMGRVEAAKKRILAEEPPTDDAEVEFQRLQRRHRVEQEVLVNVRNQRVSCSNNVTHTRIIAYVEDVIEIPNYSPMENVGFELKHGVILITNQQIHLCQLRRELEECVENDGTWTAAQMRPNAYLADGLQITAAVATGLLPPPTPDYSHPETRPFGAFAPVKPSIPSSNMRHIRQPRLKPVEI